MLNKVLKKAFAASLTWKEAVNAEMTREKKNTNT